jgi:hypothetical protein
MGLGPLDKLKNLHSYEQSINDSNSLDGQPIMQPVLSLDLYLNLERTLEVIKIYNINKDLEIFNILVLG